MSRNTAVDKALEKYNEIVNDPKTDGNVELELRFDDITHENFMVLLKKAEEQYGAGVYTTDVHVSANDVAASGGDEIRHIYEMKYRNNTRIGDIVYSTKRRVIRPVRVADFMNYRVAVAVEKIVPRFELTTNSTVRHRNRMSFKFTRDGNVWRLDLTAVVTMPMHSVPVETLRQVRDTTMGAKTIEDAIIQNQTTFEAEIELVRPGGKINAVSLEVVRDIFAMLNPKHTQDVQYQKELYQIALVMNVNNPHIYRSSNMRLKQLVPQVTSLNRSTFHGRVGSFEGYLATLKLDGERAIVSARGYGCTIIMSMQHMEFTKTEKDSSDDSTVVDAEIIFRSETQFDLYVFDVIEINGDKLTTGIAERIVNLDEACKIVAKYLPANCSCIPKSYTKVQNASKDIAALWASRAAMEKKKVGVDGLIFSEPGKKYLETTHYKWKPISHNTIDFVAKRCPDRMLGTAPYIPPKGKYCYLLFVGIQHRVRESFGLGLITEYAKIFPDVGANYYPVQFSPSYDPLAYVWYHDDGDLDGKIVELVLQKNGTTCEWKYCRTREDRRMGAKYYGNDYYVAETTYMNYIDEFQLQDLWAPASSYFQRIADALYRAPNGFKRYVIEEHIMEYFRSAEYIVDAAAGRGGDLARYRRAGVRNLLALDNDAAAINELVERGKYSAKKGGNPVYERFSDINSASLFVRDSNNMNISVARIDLGLPASPAATIVNRCLRYGFVAGKVSGVVCNFALHYFCDTVQNIKNFLQFVATMLKPNGHFMFTVMSGKAIVDKLGKAREWKVTEGDVVKYHIVANYAGHELSGFGQQIKIKLPFADEMMDEPLCNLAEVLRLAEAAGFSKVICKEMDAFMKSFSQVNSASYNSLTDHDREYIKMHRIVVLRRL